MSFIEIKRVISLLRKIQFEKIVSYSLIALVSLAASLILVMENGNIRAAFAFVIVLAVVLITFFRVDWGFYIFFGMVLLFDQFGIPGFDPITYNVHYFWNLKQIPYIPHFSAGVMNPLELQLLLLFISWFMAVSSRRRNKVQGVYNWGIALIFLTAVAASLAYGMKNGGEFLRALWEVRAFFYLGFVFFLVPQIIQTKEQIRILLWIAIFMMTIKAIQGILRYVSQGFSFGIYTCLTNHEDPVFMNVLFIFLIGLILYNQKNRQRTAMLWLLVPMLLGYMAGQRRAAVAGFIVSLGAFFVLLPGEKRRMLLKAMVPILGLFVVYSAVFWNDSGRLGLPVQMIKSGIFDTSKSESGERYDSNLYRVEEDYDLAVTIRHSALKGIGFGNKYEQPLILPPIPFPLRDWIPHNEILWVMVKMGVIGFFVFALFMDMVVFKGVTVFHEIDDPYLKAVCAAVIIAVINQMVVSYFDLQLTFYRNMIFLGTLAGFLPTISAVGKQGKKDVVTINQRPIEEAVAGDPRSMR